MDIFVIFSFLTITNCTVLYLLPWSNYTHQIKGGSHIRQANIVRCVNILSPYRGLRFPLSTLHFPAFPPKPVETVILGFCVAHGECRAGPGFSLCARVCV